MTVLEYISNPGTIDCPVCGNTQYMDIDDLLLRKNELLEKGFVSVACEECDASFILFNTFATIPEYTCRYCQDGEIRDFADKVDARNEHYTIDVECEYCERRNRE